MRYCKLVMVSAENNNRYIEMQQIDNDYFEVFTGRVDLTRIPQGKKPMRQWDSYYRSKTKSSKKPFPYTDITSNEVAVDNSYKKIESAPYLFLEYLQGTAIEKVYNTYVSSAGVTSMQIEHIGELLNKLAACNTVDQANNTLIEIYTYLPRKMDRVQNHLLSDINSLQAKIEAEQDNLDAIASQVIVSENTSVDKTLAETIGIEIEECDPDELRYVTSYGKKVVEAYKVCNPKTRERFNDKLQTKELWHGSRRSNWIKILATGLKIFAPNTNQTHRISCRLYDDGLYFADDIKKSFQYSEDVLAIFNVAVGNPYTISQSSFHGRLPTGYDSLFVKRQSYYHEYIVYNESQADIKYIVKVRK